MDSEKFLGLGLRIVFFLRRLQLLNITHPPLHSHSSPLIYSIFIILYIYAPSTSLFTHPTMHTHHTPSTASHYTALCITFHAPHTHFTQGIRVPMPQPSTHNRLTPTPHIYIYNSGLIVHPSSNLRQCCIACIQGLHQNVVPSHQQIAQRKTLFSNCQLQQCLHYNNACRTFGEQVTRVSVIHYPNHAAWIVSWVGKLVPGRSVYSKLLTRRWFVLTQYFKRSMHFTLDCDAGCGQGK